MVEGWFFGGWITDHTLNEDMLCIMSYVPLSLKDMAACQQEISGGC